MRRDLHSFIYIQLLTYALFYCLLPNHLRARKIASLRLFPDPATNKAWDKSVSDLGLEILCVSQARKCTVSSLCV